MTQYTPYWWEDAPRPVLPEKPLLTSCDVVIVGAGYAGLSAGLELARAGRSVQLIDKGVIGAAASSRSAGIASGNLRISFSKMISALGLKRALDYYAEGIEARNDLLDFLDTEKIECQLQKTGRFTAVSRADQYAQVARDIDRLNQHFHLDGYAVPKAEQHLEIGSDIYHGGVVRPDICGLHPGLLHAGMLQRTLEAGAAVHGHTAALGIKREAGKFQVSTNRGIINATEVIICTNGYTDKATPWLRRRLIPVPSLMIATEAIATEVMQRLFPTNRMCGETSHVHYYFRPSPDGRRVLIGGRTAGKLVIDGPVNYQPVQQRLIQIFPELERVEFSHVWWGYVAMNLDHLPQLGINDGIHYATGFCGSGVVWARWFGRKIALKIIADPGAKSAFDNQPFRAIPFYHGNPWFLPPAVAWYKTLDYFGF